jgi:DNA-binding FadR family transcriptional regulator
MTEGLKHADVDGGEVRISRIGSVRRVAGGDLHWRAIEGMGSEIVSGRWAAGTVFRTEDIAHDLGVSLSVAREAVRVVESLGLVARRKRVGVRVLPSSQWLALDPRVLRWRVAHDPDQDSVRRVCSSLVEVLLGLAPIAAAGAAEAAHAHEVTEISASAVAMTATRDTNNLARLVETVIDAAHDPLFSSLAESARSIDAWNTVSGGTDLQASAAVALAVAVQRRDAESARAAMSDLLAPVCVGAARCPSS